jgi:hypothetical protein
VPTESRWHPLPATVVADAGSAGEDYEVVSAGVMKVSKTMKVIEVCEAVSWKDRAMVETMYPSESAGHTKVVWAAEAMDAAKAAHAAVHPPEAVASNAAHRVGGQCWRDKHCCHDSTSDCDFAEHDNPLGCHPRAIVRAQCQMFK